eukprot:CAMPEP_0183702496 /NCGR_PEP_ID=MMETSP0737-20130205/577_1 /TAXON_ID=385413 /ORGANISM="Thalassiosira miniscula, Strain CCMP1093" /LENGTH=387 /DNA_ID=CAMNT_0025929111 /DNA_START=161 /DNA_END=1327 /DNA_ORIENTATION=+
MEDGKGKGKGKGKALARPKRPLSAFNLFYRFKRQKVLDAITLGKADKEAICSLVDAPPGLEDYPDHAAEDASPSAVKDLRRRNIRKDLEHNLMPRDTKSRAHRTNQSAMNGVVSFLELGEIMSASWKSCDDFTKSVFSELAEEGREHYRQRLKDYQEAMEPPADENDSTKKTIVSANSKDDASEEDSVENEMAEIMVKIRQNDGTKADGNGAQTRVLDEGHVAGGTQILSAMQSPNRSPNESSEEKLKSRVRELEAQLTEQRLRARIKELEDELEQRKSSERRLKAALLDNMMAQSRAASAAPNQSPMYMQQNLQPPFLNTNMMHPPHMQTGGRANMIPNIMHDHLHGQQHIHPHMVVSNHVPSSGVGRKSPETPEESVPGKKQRRF